MRLRNRSDSRRVPGQNAECRIQPQESCSRPSAARDRSNGMHGTMSVIVCSRLEFMCIVRGMHVTMKSQKEYVHLGIHGNRIPTEYSQSPTMHNACPAMHNMHNASAQLCTAQRRTGVGRGGVFWWGAGGSRKNIGRREFFHCAHGGPTRTDAWHA